MCDRVLVAQEKMQCRFVSVGAGWFGACHSDVVGPSSCVQDMASYTDENMRYELLRRQQERLRQMQPQPSARTAIDAQLEHSGAPGLQTTHFAAASSGADRQHALQTAHRPQPSPARVPPYSHRATECSPEQSVPMKRPSVSVCVEWYISC